MTTTTKEISESSVRQKAKRQGLALRKWRGREPRAIGYGSYGLIDMSRNAIVLSDNSGYGMSLEDCNDYLSEKKEGQ